MVMSQSINAFYLTRRSWQLLAVCFPSSSWILTRGRYIHCELIFFCLQPGSFDLVASVVYELNNQLHKSVFYNGTLEVVEASGFVSGETLFLVTLGLGLLGLLGMWVYAQVQRISKVVVPLSLAKKICVPAWSPAKLASNSPCSSFILSRPR